MPFKLPNMSDRRWLYALLFSLLMAANLAGSHLRNTFSNIEPAHGILKSHFTMDAPSKGNQDAPVFKVSSQGHFSSAEIQEPNTGFLPQLSPWRRALIGKRSSNADFPFYDHEVARITDATFDKLKRFEDCIHQHLGYQEFGRHKLRLANQKCLADAFAGLERLLVARGVEEIGYGGMKSGGEIWEETGAHYVRAGRGLEGGWFLVRKEGHQGENDEEHSSRHQASARLPTSAI